uniref:TSA: Wollemia nobilis Ref_Wollemi_Transcript_14200_1025 transcribed RNA sequence n=1 Tax=Wollemia nobilis TaxID=56998 RepID=A0A0C9RJV4_9CONI
MAVTKIAAMVAVFCVIISVSVALAARYPLTSQSQYTPVKFNQGFNNLWGPEHAAVSQDQSEITIWLDRNSGSGFKSLQSYKAGYFSVSMKLQAGYTAGVNTAFYLSNNQVNPDFHDEIDMEFLGTIPGRPYTLQTNIYVDAASAGTGRVITGREKQISLWFDPTNDFHRYSILWTSSHIVFFVDDNPIREYTRTDPSTFPANPMWVYGSIWDASSWATENGKYKVDYNYEPFLANYKDFILTDCSDNKAYACPWGF